MAAANMVDGEGAEVLSSMLSDAIAACSSTDGNRYMTGLSVTLPYADSTFYQKMKTVLLNCGFDETYLEWLGTFADALDIGENYYDHWEDWEKEWGGWDEYQQQRPSAPQWDKWLADEEGLNKTMINYEAQLSDTSTTLWQWDEENGIYTAQLANGDYSYQDPTTDRWYYYNVGEKSWWIWKGVTWERCENPGFPVG
jgi:polygalacturonase